MVQQENNGKIIPKNKQEKKIVRRLLGGYSLEFIKNRYRISEKNLNIIYQNYLNHSYIELSPKKLKENNTIGIEKKIDLIINNNKDEE